MRYAFHTDTQFLRSLTYCPLFHACVRCYYIILVIRTSLIRTEILAENIKHVRRACAVATRLFLVSFIAVCIAL